MAESMGARSDRVAAGVRRAVARLAIAVGLLAGLLAADHDAAFTNAGDGSYQAIGLVSQAISATTGL